MAENNQVNDRYNPPGINSTDFERYKFGELEKDELFWQTNSKTESNPWRKINQTQATNLKSQTVHNFQLSTIVYQKV
jgi:hypothetical protein|tara:strand:+ start:1636 stop:1866 length:231 start_codon:yes stop_codon:yes gene_type:complete